MAVVEESPLQQAQRHVAEGEVRIARLIRIVGHLAERGFDTSIGSELVAQFESLLLVMRSDLALLQREATKAKPPTPGFDHRHGG